MDHRNNAQLKLYKKYGLLLDLSTLEDDAIKRLSELKRLPTVPPETTYARFCNIVFGNGSRPMVTCVSRLSAITQIGTIAANSETLKCFELALKGQTKEIKRNAEDFKEQVTTIQEQSKTDAQSAFSKGQGAGHLRGRNKALSHIRVVLDEIDEMCESNTSDWTPGIREDMRKICSEVHSMEGEDLFQDVIIKILDSVSERMKRGGRINE